MSDPNQPVAPLSQEEMDRKQFADHRCAVISTLVLTILGVLLLIIGLGMKNILYIDAPGLLEVDISYFGAKVCIGSTCASGGADAVDALTCGGKGLVGAAAAFHIIALIAGVALFVLCILELSWGRDVTTQFPIPFTLLTAATICLFLCDATLGTVRSKATGSSECPGVPGIIIRYGVGNCWLLNIFAQVLFAVAWIIYVSRRYCKCCSCCCCPFPVDPNAQQGAVVVAVPVQPVQQGYPPQQQGYPPQQQGYPPQQQGYPPQQQGYPPQPGEQAPPKQI